MSSMFRAFVAIVCIATCGPSFAQVAPAPIGRAPSESELRAAQFTVFPDGRGLPTGHGDAVAGRAVYTQRCASCHGVGGEGTADFPQLIGGIGSLTSKEPIQTVGSFWPFSTTIFDYIRRSMPYGNPGSLTDDEVYAVTAYLLSANGISDPSLIIDASVLPRIEMPNRNGFVADPRPEKKRISPMRKLERKPVS